MSEDTVDKILQVAVPLQVWHSELTLELDRDLPLLDETVLRLIAAGVMGLSRISQLLALEGDQALDEVMISLLRREAISGTDPDFAITPVGRAILARASTRELQRVEVEIMRDPYTRELLWEPAEVLVRHEHDLRGMLARPLSIRKDDAGWSERLLQNQHEDVQRLIDLNGLPHESDDKARQMRNRNRQLVGIQPLRRTTIYRLVTLQVTYMPSDQRLTWRLRRGAGSHSSDRALHELEEQGLVEVLPLESVRPGVVDELCQGILSTLEQHAESFEEVGEDETSPLYSVIASARKQLLVFAPFWVLDRPDTGLLDALRRAIKTRPELKVDIVQTSELTALKMQSRQADDKAMREVARLLDELRTGVKSRVKVHAPLGKSGLSLALSEGTLAYSQTNLLTDEVRSGAGVRHSQYFELVDHQNLAPIRNQIGTALKSCQRLMI